jgi:hypothetical protein
MTIANWKVSAEKVIVAVDESKDIDLPERLRLYVRPPVHGPVD